MNSNDEESNSDKPEGTHRMPPDSVFYEKVVPYLLIGLGVVTVAMILFAAGVLLRIIPFN